MSAFSEAVGNLGEGVAKKAASKLVSWLPDIGEATAEDLARFGPQAARVRSLLKFIPTMSDEAKAVTRYAGTMPYEEFAKKYDELHDVAWDRGLVRSTIGPIVGRNETEMIEAAMAEGSADVISPQVYTSFTNPLAAGRAVDLLRNRPRYQGTPFLDVVRKVAEAGGITGPRDVVRAGRIAQKPADVQEMALTFIADGMSPEEAIRTAVMMGGLG